MNHIASHLGTPRTLVAVMLTLAWLLALACEDEREFIAAGSTCQTLIDCLPSTDLACQNGTCQKIACERSSSCPAEAYCVRGYCTAGECNAATDCPQNFACFEGACRDDLCESVEDCLTGSVCWGTPATCRPPPTSCTDDKSCLPKTICEPETGRCVTECNQDSECESDEHCDGRVCRNRCATSFDCGAEQVCHQERCVDKPQCPSNCPSTKPYHHPVTCVCQACLSDSDCDEDGTQDCTVAGLCRACTERSEDASFCNDRGLILEEGCCVACIDDVDCGSTSLRCEERACVRGLAGSCRTDDDCDEEEVCDTGTCRLLGSLTPCERQSDCQDLEACYADGRCHREGTTCDCIAPSRCVAETGDTLGTCAGCTSSCQVQGCREDEVCYVPDDKPEGYCVDAATFPGCS